MGQNKESSSSGSGIRSPVSPSASTYSSVSKWSCSTCTYLNWPQTSRCSQCCTARSRTPTSGRASPIVDKCQQSQQAQASNVNININTSDGQQRTRRSGSVNEQIHPMSPKAAKSKVKIKEINNKTLSTTYAKANCKWCCKTCTFENWPKANRCTMCGASRGRISPEIGQRFPLEISCNSTYGSLSASSISPTLNSASGGITPDYIRGPASASAMSSQSVPEISIQEENKSVDSKLKQLKNKLRENDWLWLNACNGVVTGDSRAVEAFIGSGGNPTRQLTQEEVTLVNRPSAFEVGYTLVHLAIRFRREDMLAALLSSTESDIKAIKRLPSHLNPDLATEIRREISAMLRHRKGDFPCFFVTDQATFAIPSGIHVYMYL